MVLLIIIMIFIISTLSMIILDIAGEQQYDDNIDCTAACDNDAGDEDNLHLIHDHSEHRGRTLSKTFLFVS